MQYSGAVRYNKACPSESDITQLHASYLNMNYDCMDYGNLMGERSQTYTKLERNPLAEPNNSVEFIYNDNYCENALSFSVKRVHTAHESY